jgi:hypothetical protein
VIALNSKKSINEKLINARAACHPVRIISDCIEHQSLPQPLITPVSKLPLNIKEKLKNKKLFDFDINIEIKFFLIIVVVAYYQILGIELFTCYCIKRVRQKKYY